MSEEKLNTGKWMRLRKWLLGSFLFLLLLLAGARWLLQSDLLLNYLRGMAEEEVSSLVNGSLSVERLDGDLWNGVTVTGMELLDERGERVLFADTLRISYSIFNLAGEPYELDEVIISGLNVHGEQDAGEEWNYEKLPAAGETEPGDDAAGMPFWKIHQLRLHQSSASVVSPALPDGKLLIEQLEFAGHIGYDDHEWTAAVEDLHFLLDEGRFIQPVDIGASAGIEGDHITLERLLVNTGRTIVRSRAEAELDRDIAAELELGTLSWRDIRAYADVPLEQNLEGSLGIEGSLADLRVRMDLSADGLEELNVKGRFHLGEQPSLSEFTLYMSHFNGPLLTGKAGFPVIGSLDFTGSGGLIFDQPGESRFTGSMTVEEVVFDEYALEQGSVNVDWLESEADLRMIFSHSRQTVEGEIRMQNIFDDLPDWQASFAGNGINAAELMNEPAYESNLYFEAAAEGRGFELSEEYISVDVSVRDSRWGGQQIDRLVFDGRLSADDLAGFLQIGTGDSRFVAEFNAGDWQTEPAYTFSARFEEFNLTDLQGLEDFPTHLNVTIEGEGVHFSPEELEMTAAVEFDSSFVNYESIDRLEAAVQISDQIAVVTDAELESPIADAVFSFRQHLFNLRDPGNTLEMDTRIKDVSSLAPLLGIDNLQAGGEFRGNLYRRGDGELQFDADLRMEELVYDTLFTVNETTGSMSVLLLEDPEVELDLDIQGPAGNGFRLQLVSVAASTVLQDSLVNGSLSIDLRQDDDNSLFHSGSFEYMEDNLLVRTEEFVLRTPDRALSLQRPFDLSWKDRVVQMDTLHIESPGGSAYVQMSIPRLDENRQEVTVDARRLNLGTIQRLVLNESFAGALLSGRLHFIREGEDIRSGASLLLENIRMNDGSVDSLRAVADIDNNRLQTSIGAWFENEELLTVSGNVPFAADASPTPDDEFLEQPVEGEIRVPSRAISFWRQFLDEEIEFQSEGNFFFHSTLEGTAGDPALTGRVELTDGRLSGIPIDLVEFVFGYRHDSGNIRLDGSVHSRGSRIAGVEATLPLDMDMRTYQVNFPGDSDGIFVTARSDDLDLAILNDFLDPELMRDLRGRITGDFELNGTIGEPEPSGFLRLTGGSLRVIPTAVALSDMSMDVTMNPDRLRLDSFSVRSGPGRLTANGQVDLRDLQPGNLEINLSADQFRVANTADMNAIVDISSTLQGTSERPVLTGGVNFRSGFVNLQNFGEESVEDVRLEEDEEPGSMAFYDSLAVEMNVEFDRQFFIRNQQYLDMEVELAGILDLVKEPGADLEMFGSMEGVQGYAQPLGRNFEIDEAVVTFYGPIDNPEMNIRTFYTPPQADEEITLWYIIEGTVEDPEFSFESDPVLELQDIISYTLFGRPFYALDSWQQAVSGGGQGTTAADVAMDLLLDRASIVASQQLGIDVVQIDTNRTGSGSATTIKTGWYLNNRTFFAVLNEIAGTSPKTMFQLEYMIRRNLELVITQGDDNREGVDLRWNFDY